MNKMKTLFIALLCMALEPCRPKLPIVHKFLPGQKKDLPD